MSESDVFADAPEAMKALERCSIFGSKIEITDVDFLIKISRQRLRAFDREQDGFSIEKNYGIKLLTREVFYPPPDYRSENS